MQWCCVVLVLLWGAGCTWAHPTTVADLGLNETGTAATEDNTTVTSVINTTIAEETTTVTSVFNTTLAEDTTTITSAINSTG